MKASTGYKIVFYTFVTLTILSYIHSAVSVVKFLINLF
nr:MAG TPA: hypothetical protein [Caudoviricetes sp.]